MSLMASQHAKGAEAILRALCVGVMSVRFS